MIHLCHTGKMSFERVEDILEAIEVLLSIELVNPRRFYPVKQRHIKCRILLRMKRLNRALFDSASRRPAGNPVFMRLLVAFLEEHEGKPDKPF